MDDYYQITNGPINDKDVLFTSGCKPKYQVILKWLLQGRPKDRPVVMKKGFIKVNKDVYGLIENITFENFKLSLAFYPPGVITLRDVLASLLKEYPVVLVHASGFPTLYRKLTADELEQAFKREKE